MVSMIAWVKSPHDWGFWSISSFFVDSGLGSLPNWDLTISRKLECGLEKEWQAKGLHLLIRAWSRKPSCDQWLYLTGSGWGIWRGFYDNAAFKVIQPRGSVRLLDALSQKKLFFFHIATLPQAGVPVWLSWFSSLGELLGLWWSSLPMTLSKQLVTFGGTTWSSACYIHSL